jgi:hypothetical protein
MTSRPTSHLIHSGFLDILSLIPPGEQQQIPSSRNGRPEDGLRQILRKDPGVVSGVKSPRKAIAAAPSQPQPQSNKNNNGRKEKRTSVKLGLRKRRIDKESIGPPVDFRFVSPCS